MIEEPKFVGVYNNVNKTKTKLLLSTMKSFLAWIQLLVVLTMFSRSRTIFANNSLNVPASAWSSVRAMWTSPKFSLKLFTLNSRKRMFYFLLFEWTSVRSTQTGNITTTLFKLTNLISIWSKPNLVLLNFNFNFVFIFNLITWFRFRFRFTWSGTWLKVCLAGLW